MKQFSAGRGPIIHLDPTSVMDIGSCIVANTDIAPGRAIPDDGDARIDHSLEGFLFTCGPDHIRHPVPIDGDASGKRYPLHGSFSSHPLKSCSGMRRETRRSARRAFRFKPPMAALSFSTVTGA